MQLLLLAIVAALALAGTVQFFGARSEPAALFTFEADAMAATPEDVAAALGGPLTPAEAAAIEQMARREVEQAFAGFGLRVVRSGRAFWRVRVVPVVIAPDLRGRPRRNAAGAAYAFGMLGGGAFVNFSTLASKAARYAPPGTTRQQLVEAIGRGIGRSAVHELAHLIAGSAPIHSHDENSYEFDNVDRASQYYGRLTWAEAGPMLERALGPARAASGSILKPDF